MLDRLALAILLGAFAAPAATAQGSASQGAVRAVTATEPLPPGSVRITVVERSPRCSRSDLLIVLNGEPLPHDQTVPPLQQEDIVSIQVVPGEEALARFGDLAQNGVIEVITAPSAGPVQGVLMCPPGLRVPGEAESIQSLSSDKVQERSGDQVKDEAVEVVTSFRMAPLHGAPPGLSGTEHLAEKPASWELPPPDALNPLQADSTRVHIYCWPRPPVGPPLYVLDGQVLGTQDHHRLQDLEADNIESVDVMKDEEAIAQYGPEGENGVIVIVTKAGSRAAPQPLSAESDKRLPEHTDLRIEGNRTLCDLGPSLVFVLNGEVLSSEAITWRRLKAEDIASIRVLSADEAREQFGDLSENPIVEILTVPPVVLPAEPGDEPRRIRIGMAPPAGPPLVELDGHIVEMDVLNALNPDDIETAGVVTGGEALVCYGAAGAYGVVRIVTKAGADAQRSRSPRSP